MTLTTEDATVHQGKLNPSLVRAERFPSWYFVSFVVSGFGSAQA
jgi:hypothetical protein